MFSDFIAYAISNKIRPDEKNIASSKSLISNQLKANIARLLFGNDGYYRITLQEDKAYKIAVELSEQTNADKTVSARVETKK